MQRKKQSATLSQLALHFAVFTPNCIKQHSLCQKETPSIRMGFSFWLWQHASHLPSGYVSDERSSLGKRGERCQWQVKRPERSAAVGINLRPLRWV